MFSFTDQEPHDPAGEVAWLGDNDEGGGEREEGADDEDTAELPAAGPDHRGVPVSTQHVIIISSYHIIIIIITSTTPRRRWWSSPDQCPQRTAPLGPRGSCSPGRSLAPECSP